MGLVLAAHRTAKLELADEGDQESDQGSQRRGQEDRPCQGEVRRPEQEVDMSGRRVLQHEDRDEQDNQDQRDDYPLRGAGRSSRFQRLMRLLMHASPIPDGHLVETTYDPAGPLSRASLGGDAPS